MNLSDICIIQIGYTAKAKFEPADDGVLTIQLRDLTEDGLDISQIARVRVTARVDRYLVQAGDVLFRSRGERNTAVALDERFGEPAVAVSPLMVLRPNPSTVIPEYLAWAINQPEAQRHFDAAARGTSIRMVPKTSLDDLRIDVPDLETQQHIVAVDALAARERALTHLLADTKRDLTNRLLAERSKGNRPAIPKRENRA